MDFDSILIWFWFRYCFYWLQFTRVLVICLLVADLFEFWSCLGWSLDAMNISSTLANWIFFSSGFVWIYLDWFLFSHGGHNTLFLLVLFLCVVLDLFKALGSFGFVVPFFEFVCMLLILVLWFWIQLDIWIMFGEHLV